MSWLQRVQDIQRNGRSTLAARWKILDRTFLKPLFGGRERLAADGVQGYPLGPDGMDGDDSDDSGDGFEIATGCVGLLTGLVNGGPADVCAALR